MMTKAKYSLAFDKDQIIFLMKCFGKAFQVHINERHFASATDGLGSIVFFSFSHFVYSKHLTI